MKITARQLRQIIKEELSRSMYEAGETSAAQTKLPAKSTARYAVFLDGNIISAGGSPKPMSTEALVPYLAKNIRAKQMMLLELDSKNAQVGDWIDMKNEDTWSTLREKNPALASISYTAATLIGEPGSGSLEKLMTPSMQQLRNALGSSQAITMDGTFTVGAEGFKDVKVVIKDSTGKDLSSNASGVAGGLKTRAIVGSPIEYTFTYGIRSAAR
jgi:hypothetical protein